MKSILILLLPLFLLQSTSTKVKIKEISAQTVLNDNKTNVTAWGFGNHSKIDVAQSMAFTTAASNLSKMVVGVDYSFKNDGFSNEIAGTSEAVLKDIKREFMEIISTSPARVICAVSVPSVDISFSKGTLGAFITNFQLDDPARLTIDFEKGLSESVKQFLTQKKVENTTGKYVVHSVQMNKHKRKDIYKVEMTIILSY